jgi:hypothetical protein
MKIIGRIFVAILLLTASAAGDGIAGPGGLGLGIILGEPTGLCAKKWIGPDSAVDLAAAWSFRDDGSFQIHADYLRHTGRFSGEYRDRLLLYYGVGGRFGFSHVDEGGRNERDSDEDDFRAGIRIPLGVTWLFTGAPVDVFFEVVPIMDVAPATDLDLAGAVGGRYYFR